MVILMLQGTLLPCLAALFVAASAPATGSTGRAARPTTAAVGSNAAAPSAQCDEAVKGVEPAAGAGERASARLAAAHCLLVTQCCVPLSRMLVDPRNKQSRRLVKQVCARALALLEDTLDEIESTPLDEDERETLMSCAFRLRGFGELFAAMAADPDDSGFRERLSDAGIGLAIYLDDTESGIVESARFWQGAADRRSGRPDRALQVLRPALSRWTSNRMGLLAGLERCRALSDRGMHAAALALAARISSRVDSWFADEDAAVQAHAGDTVRFLRYELLQDWAKRLEEDGHADRAAQARDQAAKALGEDKWPVPADRRLALDVSIAGLSDCGSLSDGASEEASTTSSSPTDGEDDELSPRD